VARRERRTFRVGCEVGDHRPVRVEGTSPVDCWTRKNMALVIGTKGLAVSSIRFGSGVIELSKIPEMGDQSFEQH
jgi:hypothetical protein